MHMNKTQKITLIAAVADNRCIGGNNQMLWHIPEDFAFFKRYTLGKTIVMGRKTWDSLPKKPLPQRRNIVLTRRAIPDISGAECLSNWKEVWESCSDDEVVVIGGAQIYEQVLAIATDLRITEVHTQVDGDAYFPIIDRHIWREVDRVKHVSEQSGLSFDFVHYQKMNTNF